MCNCKKNSSKELKKRIEKQNLSIQETLKKIKKHIKG